MVMSPTTDAGSIGTMYRWRIVSLLEGTPGHGFRESGRTRPPTVLLSTGLFGKCPDGYQGKPADGCFRNGLHSGSTAVAGDHSLRPDPGFRRPIHGRTHESRCRGLGAPLPDR